MGVFELLNAPTPIVGHDFHDHAVFNLINLIGRVGRAERMGLAISLSSTVKEKVIICVLAFKALVLLLFYFILRTE